MWHWLLQSALTNNGTHCVNVSALAWKDFNSDSAKRILTDGPVVCLSSKFKEKG